MKVILIAQLALALAGTEQRSEFCDGFKDGWNAGRGGLVVPVWFIVRP
jgi:hypothetical protein